jgi:DNA-binding GntR family transcriptional regulator
MSVLPKIGNKVSLTQRAYESIKDAIIMNHFKPGDILSEEKLAEDLAISRTPVRSALKMLAFEHLVILNPSKNIVVTSISQEDIEDITVARIPIEVTAAGLVANKANEEKLKVLEDLLAVQRRAIEVEDYELFIKTEYDFHVYLGKMTQNKWLEEMITKVNTIIQRYLILSGSLSKHAFSAELEHEEILNAIKEGNSAKAEKMMLEHLNNVSERMLK